MIMAWLDTGEQVANNVEQVKGNANFAVNLVKLSDESEPPTLLDQISHECHHDI